MSRTIATLALAAWVVFARPTLASAEPCSDDDLNRILAPAQGDDTTAAIDCDLDLSPLTAAAITRTLVFLGAASSGVTLDCHGGVLGSAEAPASILVHSRRIGPSSIEGISRWEPVTDVTIRDCEIHGSVRIRGMQVGGRTAEATLSSHVRFGHVARLREAGPRRVTLDGITLVAVGPVPLYVSMGTQDTTLVRSYVTGRSKSVAIYLDAESRGTTIRDCTLDTNTPRELLAIDGSDENRVIGNVFSQLSHGGIFLYRNCGERTTVRFTTPQHNEIINNVFEYDGYVGPNPAVFLGSDNGFSTHRFCHHDIEYPFGSGADDRDFAARNAVMQNQIVGRSPGDVIHTEWPDTNAPNYIELNTAVTSAVSRPAGCFIPPVGGSRFLPHGASATLVVDRDGHPFTHAVEATCAGGVLAFASTPVLAPIREVPFSCSASGDNGGCRGQVKCPDGATLVGAHAACNLEYGPVTDAQLASVPPETIRVMRASDVPLAGRCWVDAHGAAAGELSLASGLAGGAGEFGCREHDRNGGDCEIRGVAYCAKP